MTLEGKKILVTGATGLIGFNLVEKLKQIPNCTVIAVYHQNHNLSGGVLYAEGDLLNYSFCENITKNINYLVERNLLVKELYQNSRPIGIFAVINKSEDYLFQHKIGAVGLDKFVYHDKDIWSSYSRICVSVKHELFKKFIINI
jgi:dihydrodipicolinate reductase